MTAVGSFNKENLGLLLISGVSEKRDLTSDSDPGLTSLCLSSEFLRQNHLELLLYQHFHNLLLCVNVRSQSLSSKLLQMSEDIPGPSHILVAELPKSLPGNCRVGRIPSQHGLKSLRRSSSRFSDGSSEGSCGTWTWGVAIRMTSGLSAIISFAGDLI